MKHIGNFQRYIEESDWDKQLEDDFRYLDWFCWGVIIVAVLYFGGITLAVLMR